MDRQRVVMIFGVALLCATGLTWFLFAQTKAPRQEKRVLIMAAARDLPLGTLVKKSDLRPISVLDRDLPRGALREDREAVNRVTLYPVTRNEPITGVKLSSVTAVEGIPSTIEPGYRAVSVPVTDVSGVAGLVQPGSRVDVIFTKPGSMAEAITSTILQNVKVLSVGRLTQAGQTVDPKAPKMPVATLVVTPEEAQKLELAKNQGKVSLALRNPLDASSPSSATPVTTEIIDPMISARLARARRGRTTNFPGKAPNLEDPRVWQELTGEKKLTDKQEDERKKKEAEKPRWVVDVYKGDKHVQELFR